MTEQELTAVVNGVVAAVRGELSQLKSRVDAVEKREPVHGQDGAPGKDGKDAQVDPLLLKSIQEQLERIDALEKRQPVHGRDGKDGEKGEKGDSVDPLFVQRLMDRLETLEARQLVHGKDGAPGKDADPAVVTAMQDRIDLLEKKLAEIADEYLLDVEAITGNVVAQMRSPWPAPVNGKDGTSVTLEQLQPMVDGAVQKAFAGVHIPKDGQDGAPGTSVDPAAVDDMVARHVAAAVGLIPVPKDGVGIVDALVNRAGNLVVTLSDGTIKDVGSIVGRDVDMVAVERLVREEIAKIPVPQDGKDGLGFDDFDEEFDGERTYTRRYKRGDVVKEYKWTVPFVLDRGVWKGGAKYERGDGVTYAGSFWICQQETSARPGDAQDESRAWRLSVKKGADGKEGKAIVGPVGPVGPQGPPGRVYS